MRERDKREIQELLRETLQEVLPEILPGILRAEIQSFFTRKFKIERSPRKQGDPDGKVISEENHDVLNLLAEYIPLIEAAIRGNQLDVGKMKNNVNRLDDKIEKLGLQTGQIGHVLIGLEDPISRILRETSKLTGASIILPPDKRPALESGDGESDNT